VTLIGRYSNDESLDSLRLTLTGQANGSTRTYTYDNLSLPLRNENNEYLPRLWATRRVGWLMEAVRTNGEQKELRDEIIDLGTRYGIVTPYTSYLAVENEQISRQGLYNLTPAGRVAGGFSRGALNAPKSAPSATPANTGIAAVQQSKVARQQKEVLSLESDDTRKDAVRRVGDKTFYLIEGVWTDSEFKAEAHLPETTLTFGSDEYFAVLKQYPKLASYFSLAERVVVVFEGRVYRVSGSA